MNSCEKNFSKPLNFVSRCRFPKLFKHIGKFKSSIQWVSFEALIAKFMPSVTKTNANNSVYFSPTFRARYF